MKMIHIRNEEKEMLYDTKLQEEDTSTYFDDVLYLFRQTKYGYIIASDNKIEGL